MNVGNTVHRASVTSSRSSGWANVVAQLAVIREFYELTKPRLSLLTVITAVVGYLVANPDRNFSVLISLFIGTCLAAGAAGALNQWLEHEVDSRMVRTRNRPIPSGQVSPETALIYGLVLAIAGLGILWVGTNPLATALTFATLGSYLLVYTPLKLKTRWCTMIGAIPGALPPLVGWAAADNSIGLMGWILFGILFTWQIPHFMAIAWTCREDYRQGGFQMATIVEPTGRSAGLESFVHAALLLVLSLVPGFLGFTTFYLYEPVAALAGSYYLYCAYTFWQEMNKDHSAKRLFYASISYLPLLLAVLVLDRWLLA